jgi:glycosyltransferase involved in cell wall biosynthesis
MGELRDEHRRHDLSRRLHLVVPGPLDQRTGGYIYDRRMAHGLRALGWQVRVHELEGTFPITDAAARTAAAACLDACRFEPGVLLIDALALPAFADLVDALPSPWLALVHHPLALETGLDEAEAAALGTLERRLLAGAARIIVTSRGTARDLAAGYGIGEGCAGIVPPGTDPAPQAPGSGGPETILLCVGALTPRKGHAVLIDALARLRDLDWRLVCVGSTVRDRSTAEDVLRSVAAKGLRERVRFVGEQDEGGLGFWYSRADLCVLASYHEGYGMVLAEALARGLPVIATRAGAIPDTVPDDAGHLVPPGDPAAMAEALRRVLCEPEHRASLRRGAAAARQRLPGWPEAVRAFAAELERVF